MSEDRPRYTEEPPFGWTAAGFEIYMPGDPELKRLSKDQQALGFSTSQTAYVEGEAQPKRKAKQPKPE